jgi:cytosine/adenosine deaminase-related metal-dependent hydrolase
MESFQRYLDHGINVCIGTDVYPLDMLEEMRATSIVGKVIDANFESAHARDVFNAATLGGAKAIGRDEGRHCGG